MELTFHDMHEFESFARTYVAGVAARDSTGPTTIGGLTVELKPGESFNRLKREVLACAMADTGLSEEELTREPEAEAAVRARPAGVRLEPIPGDAEDVADMAELYADHPEALGNGDPDPQPTPDDGIVHEHIDLPPTVENEQELEKPKRKRRSKAEIEAAALAEQRTFDPAQEAPEAGEMPEGYVAQLEAADVKVIEAEAEKPKDAPKPAGASADAVEKHAAAQAEYTPELIETLKGQAELFDANRTAHLNEGREAIAKHGFIKYMATFKGLGLDSAIATYNDDQVKLHRAAIAHLMAA